MSSPQHHLLRYALPLVLLACLLAAPSATAEMPADPPPPLEARSFQVPLLNEYTLDNGLRVLLVEDHELPMVWMQVVFRGGSWTDPDGKEGLAQSAMQVMDNRTDSKDGFIIRAQKYRTAATLETVATLDGSTLSASCLTQHLEETVSLMGTVLQEPSYWKQDWDSFHDHYLAKLKSSRDSQAICSEALSRVLHGDRYAGRFPTEESLAAIHGGDLRDWHEQYIHPGDALVLVSGDTTLEEVVPMIEQALSGWEARTATAAPIPVPYQPAATTLYLVDNPGSVQSAIGVGRFAASPQDDDYLPFYLGHLALAGMFSGRINTNLREDLGVTYGVSGTIQQGYGPSRWQLVTSVDGPATAQAVTEILEEVRAVRGDQPLTADELEVARCNGIRIWPARFEDKQFALEEMAHIWRYDLPADWLAGYQARLREVQLDDVNAALATYLDPDAMAIVIVGDMAQVRPALEDLGLPMVKVDEWGRATE